MAGELPGVSPGRKCCGNTLARVKDDLQSPHDRVRLPWAPQLVFPDPRCQSAPMKTRGCGLHLPTAGKVPRDRAKENRE
jgi:hypothetical protein